MAGLGLGLVGELPASLPEGGSAEIEVSCTPRTDGERTGKLHVRAEAPGGDLQAEVICRAVPLERQTWPDAAGDAPTADLLSVDYEVLGGEGVVTLRFDGPVRLIGSAGSGPIVGAEVHFDTHGGDIDTEVFFEGLVPLDDGWAASAELLGDQVRVRVPGELLSGGTCLDLAVTVAALDASGQFVSVESFPDSGTISVTAGCPN